MWHPTQKPVALGRYLIRMFVPKGGLILGNAFGSGSFLVAAAMEGRKYIGIEKNEECRLFKNERIDYIRVAKDRLAQVDDMMANKKPFPPLLSSLLASGLTNLVALRWLVFNVCCATNCGVGCHIE